MPRTGPGWYTATSSRPTSWSTNAPAGLRYLWKVATGTLTATFTRDLGASVNSVAFGPGGTTLATGNADGSTDLWRIRSGKA
jgi:WD40 repeat protein